MFRCHYVDLFHMSFVCYVIWNQTGWRMKTTRCFTNIDIVINNLSNITFNQVELIYIFVQFM